MNNQHHRDETFDTLKGIAIILMLVGHCETGPLIPFIFSFHMPLFFFVAGYFLRLRPLQEELSLSFKRLIIPYIFTAACICIAAICQDILNYTWADGSHSQGKIIAFLLGFKGQAAPNWVIDRINAPWFMLALFWARLLAIALIKKCNSTPWLCVIFFVIALTGIILNKFVFIPFCIPQGMCAAGFVFTGYLLKKYDFFETHLLSKIFPFLAIIWFCSFSRWGVSIADCQFSIGYVFGLLGGLGALVILYKTVKCLHSNTSTLWNAIHFLGRYSLVFYCSHSIEDSIFNWKAFALHHHIPLDYFSLFQVSVRMSIAVIFTLLLLKIGTIRENVFQIKGPYSFKYFFQKSMHIK